MDEVAKAYRKQAQKYHPDRLEHFGEEFKIITEQKMKEINESKDYFMNKFPSEK